MQRKYGEVAVDATRYVRETQNLDPKNAWKRAAEEVFDAESSSAKKACPRNAYLGLCEEGMISGIPTGDYVKEKGGTNSNKSYAVQAVHMLRDDPTLADVTPKELWDKVMEVTEDPPDNHNNQMDVVLALWDEDMIVRND